MRATITINMNDPEFYHPAEGLRDFLRDLSGTVGAGIIAPGWEMSLVNKKGDIIGSLIIEGED